MSLSRFCVGGEHLEFISGRTVQRRLEDVCILSLGAQLPLLATLSRACPVPVGAHRLVVPHGGRLRVADVARVARVVRGEHQQGLGGKRPHVSPLEVRHVLFTAETENTFMIVLRKIYLKIQTDRQMSHTGCLLYMTGRNSSTGSILFRGSARRSFWAPRNEIM